MLANGSLENVSQASDGLARGLGHGAPVQVNRHVDAGVTEQVLRDQWMHVAREQQGGVRQAAESCGGPCASWVRCFAWSDRSRVRMLRGTLIASRARWSPVRQRLPAASAPRLATRLRRRPARPSCDRDVLAYAPAARCPSASAVVRFRPGGRRSSRGFPRPAAASFNGGSLCVIGSPYPADLPHR